MVQGGERGVVCEIKGVGWGFGCGFRVFPSSQTHGKTETRGVDGLIDLNPSPYLAPFYLLSSSPQNMLGGSSIKIFSGTCESRHSKVITKSTFAGTSHPELTQLIADRCVAPFFSSTSSVAHVAHILLARLVPRLTFHLPESVFQSRKRELHATRLVKQRSESSNRSARMTSTSSRLAATMSMPLSWNSVS